MRSNFYNEFIYFAGAMQIEFVLAREIERNREERRKKNVSIYMHVLFVCLSLKPSWNTLVLANYANKKWWENRIRW